MSTSQTPVRDPFNRLPGIFGQVLANERRRTQITEDGLALSVGLTTSAAVTELESGTAEPTLTQFFRIAGAIGKAPTLLLVDVIEAWRSEPMEGFRRSRPHDFAHIYRLGFNHKIGDFRELGATYPSSDRASKAADQINVQRQARRAPLLDTISVYVRLDSLRLKSRDEANADRQGEGK